MPQQQPEQKPTKPADVVAIVFTVANVYMTCFTPFIRCQFGCRAFSAAPMSFFWMVAFAGFANCPLIAWYSVLWMVAVVFRWLTSSRYVHSRYQGFPYVFGWILGEYMARIAEMLILFFMGVFAEVLAPGGGNFFFYGIGALLIVLGVETATLRARKMAMQDAQVNARQMSGMNRGGNGW
jgi:hypothetical protein